MSITPWRLHYSRIQVVSDTLRVMNEQILAVYNRWFKTTTIKHRHLTHRLFHSILAFIGDYITWSGFSSYKVAPTRDSINQGPTRHKFTHGANSLNIIYTNMSKEICSTISKVRPNRAAINLRPCTSYTNTYARLTLTRVDVHRSTKHWQREHLVYDMTDPSVVPYNTK